MSGWKPETLDMLIARWDHAERVELTASRDAADDDEESLEEEDDDVEEDDT